MASEGDLVGAIMQSAWDRVWGDRSFFPEGFNEAMAESPLWQMVSGLYGSAASDIGESYMPDVQRHLGVGGQVSTSDSALAGLGGGQSAIDAWFDNPSGSTGVTVPGMWTPRGGGGGPLNYTPEMFTPPDFSAVRSLLEEARPEGQEIEDRDLEMWAAGLLAGAAQAQGGGWGDMLLAAAGGGLGGLINEQERRDDLTAENEAAMRDYLLGLAQSELGMTEAEAAVERANVETRNRAALAQAQAARSGGAARPPQGSATYTDEGILVERYAPDGSLRIELLPFGSAGGDDYFTQVGRDESVPRGDSYGSVAETWQHSLDRTGSGLTILGQLQANGFIDEARYEDIFGRASIATNPDEVIGQSLSDIFAAVPGAEAFARNVLNQSFR